MHTVLSPWTAVRIDGANVDDRDRMIQFGLPDRLVDTTQSRSIDGVGNPSFFGNRRQRHHEDLVSQCPGPTDDLRIGRGEGALIGSNGIVDSDGRGQRARNGRGSFRSPPKAHNLRGCRQGRH